MGPWTTVASGSEWIALSLRFCGGKWWNVSLNPPTESADKAHIATLAYSRVDDQIRLTAVDDKGQEHTASSENASPSGDISQVTATFQNLSLKQIKGLCSGPPIPLGRVPQRAVQPKAEASVARRSSKPPDTQPAPASFGPVVERVVNPVARGQGGRRTGCRHRQIGRCAEGVCSVAGRTANQVERGTQRRFGGGPRNQRPRQWQARRGACRPVPNFRRFETGGRRQQPLGQRHRRELRSLLASAPPAIDEADARAPTGPEERGPEAAFSRSCGSSARCREPLSSRLAKAIRHPATCRVHQRAAGDEIPLQTAATAAAAQLSSAVPDEKAIEGTWEVVNSNFGLINRLPYKDVPPEEIFKTTG